MFAGKKIFPSFFIGIKLFYDCHGKQFYNGGKTLLKNHLVKSFTIVSAGTLLPTYPLPEHAEYTVEVACLKPLERKRLFVAHLHKGVTKKTLDAHGNHLCKFNLDTNADFVYCPSSCYIDYVRRIYPECVSIGVQNIYPLAEGNFTGEISASMAKEKGVSYVLVGCSQRRIFFGETNKFVVAKIKATLEEGLKCLIFVGNCSGVCNECGTTEKVIDEQLAAILPAIGDSWSQVAFAYESPVCSQEEGMQQIDESPAVVQKMCKLVRDRIADRIGDELAGTVRIIFSGGDICHANVPYYMAQKDIDGAVFCPNDDTECFMNIVNSGILSKKRTDSDSWPTPF